MVLGFSLSSQSQDLPSAKADSLWQDQAWLRLGHYQHGVFGWHSPFRGPFFIDPDGARNPRAELIATLRAFTHPSSEDLARYQGSPICFFKARYRWLRQHVDLPQAVSCPERDAWKQKLNATAVTLIFAASDLSTATSSFGHTFLKLSNPDNRGGKELLDYGLNYAADANKNDGLFYALKGLFGFYRGHFSLLPYHQKLREYANVEGRDLWEYPLRLSADQVSLLIDHVLELEGSSAPYYFISQNCSYELLRVLEVADPSVSVSQNLPFMVIPLDAVKRVRRDTDLITGSQFRRSLKSDYLERFSLLTRKDREALEDTVLQLRPPENLPRENQALLLETAMKYYALESFEKERNFDQQEYTLSLRRARLGAVAESAPPPPAPMSPDQSHDSSAVYLGYGSSTGQPFTSLKFRTAFHDLEQSDFGTVAFSRSNILAAELRRYEMPDRWSLARMTWIDILNTAPLNPLERTLSWKARFETRDPWQQELEAGAGFSVDLMKTSNLRARASALLDIEYFRTHARMGPDLIVIARAFDRFGLSIESAFYMSPVRRPEVPIYVSADFELARNWDLRFDLRSHEENQIRLVYNFLL